MTDTVELANSIHQFLLTPAAYPDHPRRVELNLRLQRLAETHAAAQARL